MSQRGGRAGGFRGRWGRWLLALYLALLGLSHLARLKVDPPRPPETCCQAPVPVIPADQAGRIQLGYVERPGRTERSPVILLHGSPGDSGDFKRLVPVMDGKHRLIAPDLPGFGRSTRRIPDYSIRAHAGYVLSMMDALGIEQAHVVGFSMGGGVALNLYDLAPRRVRSIVMLSAIGVQEMELLGDYHLNHAVHGVQLAFFKALQLGLPLTPAIARSDITVPYARNFYDTDQRPLREILMRCRVPMLIIHGRKDFLVPVEAAIEHHRLVPQSQLELIEDDHFMVFLDPEKLAPRIDGFLEQVDDGRWPTRFESGEARLLAAQRVFDPADLPKFTGLGAVVVMLLLALATLVSEDLTCIAAGIMASQGRLDFTLATLGCFTGIFVGDLMLYLAGRWLGRPALGIPPLRWLIRPADLARSSEWFSRQGPKVILLSRFMPGTRLPAYFAAGALETGFWRFAIYFFIACAVWTPLLVGFSMLLGGSVAGSGLWRVVPAVLAVYLSVRLLTGFSTHSGRRLLLSSWRRLSRWEFWPPWAFYPPVLVYIGWLMLRYRSLTVFTASNPAIPGSGFIGESKAQILEGLRGAGDWLPKWMLLEKRLPLSECEAAARSFMAGHGISYPIVLKPDAGQRGSGVAIIRSDEDLSRYIATADFDILIQEYISGDEYGIFYYRYPDEDSGRILAVTEKRFPFVVGDGLSTLEELILNDDRAVCMARHHLERHAGRLRERIPEGERFPLVEVGTHCRGALFLDGGEIVTDELTKSIDRLSRSFEGFYFGRFDIRVEDPGSFGRGGGFKVIELNGVTSEATSIYDPRHSLLDAYRTLFEQWRIAFRIGHLNRLRGARPTPVRTLLSWLIAYREKSQNHDRYKRIDAKTPR
ncbi:MAG: alpha/beta fold hydrolase [Acidobacteriota bacterium]|nr:MAG: alpha/beta fold hydrolase [Acidobacteriota bacterium]